MNNVIPRPIIYQFQTVSGMSYTAMGPFFDAVGDEINAIMFKVD